MNQDIAPDRMKMWQLSWQLSSLQSGGLRLVKSNGKLAFPAKCCRWTW